MHGNSSLQKLFFVPYQVIFRPAPKSQSKYWLVFRVDEGVRALAIDSFPDIILLFVESCLVFATAPILDQEWQFGALQLFVG